MSTITIKDLHTDRLLDRAAMSSIRGGGAPWVYGWIRPFSNGAGAGGQAINFYQINNYADQMLNQFQTIEVNNTGANSNINVIADEHGMNTKNL